jgi:hypothetical protein
MKTTQIGTAKTGSGIMPHDVFISYSHKDKPIADAICANLEIVGFRCWIAPRDIAPGLDWPTAISNAISASRLMVLVFSANSNSSNDVSRELILAANSNLIIIPFKIDNITPEPGKQYYLARTHWLDAMNPPTQDQINTLVAYVRSFLSEQGTTGTVQPAPEVKPPPPQTVKVEPTSLQKRAKGKSIWIWSFLVVMAIIAGSIFAIRSFGQVTMPTSTFTPTLTPISTSTTISVPTSTPSPTITITRQPYWVTGFAQPILDAIVSRTPSFQDDFHDRSGGWKLGSYFADWRLEYLNGELILNRCYVYQNNIDYRNYVVEVDARFLSGSDPTYSYLYMESPRHNFSVYYEGQVEIDHISFPSGIANAGTQSNQLMMIAKRPRYAFYLNGQPLYYLEDDVIEYGEFRLRARNPDDGPGGPMVTTVAFDNFKIWDISDIVIP